MRSPTASICLNFAIQADKPLPQFSAGAHIAIRVPNGMLRKYSLCNDPAERDRYQIAVKRETNGRGGSCSLIDDVKAGDELTVTAPVNDFGLPPARAGFPVHCRRHRRDADDGDDPAGDGGG